MRMTVLFVQAVCNLMMLKYGSILSLMLSSGMFYNYIQQPPLTRTHIQ